MISLGIDIGTSKVALSVYDFSQRKALFTNSLAHSAQIEPIIEGKAEQKVSKIIQTIVSLVKTIPDEYKQKISKIGVTGQMHGIILISENQAMEDLILVTWQDSRASYSGKLAEITKKKGCEQLKDGFGFTTLGCSDLSKVVKCGTIHDYFVSLLCERDDIITDPTDAASWGLFDIQKMEWRREAIEELSIDPKILPKIVPSGEKAGNLSERWAKELSLPSGIPVTVPLGDNQASVLGTGKNFNSEMYITIGTGTQLSFVTSIDKAEEFKGLNVELRPFPGGKILAVSAPLCGGQAWKFLADTVRSWSNDLGFALSEKDSYEKIDELGLREFDSSDLPVFSPHFLGERWDPNLRASISQIDLHNFGLGKVSAALAKGIIKTLRAEIPQSFFTDIKTISISGNAVRQSKVLQKAIQSEFGIAPSFTNSKEEAACGAAILSFGSL